MEEEIICSKYSDHPEVLTLVGDYCSLLKREFFNGLRISTPREEMDLRISSYEKSNIGLHDGLWTSATLISGMKRKSLLTLSFKEIICEYLVGFSEKEFVFFSKNCDKGYFTTKNLDTYKLFYKKAKNDLEKSVSKRENIILPSSEDFFITKDENFYVLEFLARSKKRAEEYFNLNGEEPIKFGLIKKELVNSSTQTVLNQVWFSSIESGSKLSGNRNLKYIGNLRCMKK